MKVVYCTDNRTYGPKAKDGIRVIYEYPNRWIKEQVCKKEAFLLYDSDPDVKYSDENCNPVRLSKKDIRQIDLAVIDSIPDICDAEFNKETHCIRVDNKLRTMVGNELSRDELLNLYARVHRQYVRKGEPRGNV